MWWWFWCCWWWWWWSRSRFRLAVVTLPLGSCCGIPSIPFMLYRSWRWPPPPPPPPPTTTADCCGAGVWAITDTGPEPCCCCCWWWWCCCCCCCCCCWFGDGPVLPLLLLFCWWCWFCCWLCTCFAFSAALFRTILKHKNIIFYHCVILTTPQDGM